MKTTNVFLKLLGGNRDAYLVQDSNSTKRWIPRSQVFSINYSPKYPLKYKIKTPEGDVISDFDASKMIDFEQKILEFEIGRWFAEEVGILKNDR